MVFEKYDKYIFCGIVNNLLTRRASCKCTLQHAASHSVRANSYSAVSSGTITSSEKIISRVCRSGLPVAWSLCNKFLLLEKKQQWNILQQTWHQHQTAMQHRLIATMLYSCFQPMIIEFLGQRSLYCETFSKTLSGSSFEYQKTRPDVSGAFLSNEFKNKNGRGNDLPMMVSRNSYLKFKSITGVSLHHNTCLKYHIKLLMYCIHRDRCVCTPHIYLYDCIVLLSRWHIDSYCEQQLVPPDYTDTCPECVMSTQWTSQLCARIFTFVVSYHFIW